jgi:DNA replication terminus site-binding protein
MNKRFLLRAHFDTCNQLVAELQEALKNADLEFCHYYLLPKIKEEAHHSPPTNIEVQPFKEMEALNLCLSAYNDWFKQPRFSGKLLTRHPAVIGIKGVDQKIEALILAINAEKHAFKQIVLSEKTKDARFELVHSTIPNLITLAFYRQLFFEKRPAYSLRFTWMHKHSIQHLNVKQALAFLQNNQSQKPLITEDKADWNVMLEKEKQRIINLSDDHKLRIRRPIRVSPQVNVRFSASDRYHVSAALPFILFNAEHTEKVGQLKNYVKKADARQKKSRYLIERLFLETP